MAPLCVGNGVRCKLTDKYGTVKEIVRKRENKSGKVLSKVCFILWEGYNYPVPHSRSEFKRDHTELTFAKWQITATDTANFRIKNELGDESLPNDAVVHRPPFIPTGKNYYQSEQQNRQQQAELEAIEDEELEQKLEENLIVNTTLYKTVDYSKVLFVSYEQIKHKIASDYSIGPMYIIVE